MSYDLILKHTKYNWARGAQRSAGLSATAALTAAAPKPPTLKEKMWAKLKLTPEEQKKLAQVKAVKAAAQRGDKRAQKMWAKAPKYIAKLKADHAAELAKMTTENTELRTRLGAAPRGNPAASFAPEHETRFVVPLAVKMIFLMRS